MRIGSLFAGAGGLDMAVQAVFGGDIAWHSEIDKAASKVLAYRFPGVPNLGDITAVDWADVPAVDVLCGGFPCQDVSAAGKRAGIKDGTRSGLWAVFAEAIDALRPQYVVIENVRGLLSAEAKRSEVDEQQPCVCGWLDRWRRFSGSGLPEARESAGSLELLRLGDDWDDRAGEADSGVDSPGVGRIASPAQGGGREGVPSLAVAGVGRQGGSDSADAVAAFEIEGTAGATCVGSGADSGEPSKDEQWRCGVDTAIACRVREDQAADAPAERERPRCEKCGGFLPSGAADSGVESANAALGNGSDGPLLRAAGAVCADLADLGYDAQWATVAAASVGAPHRRERVFILASDTQRGGGEGFADTGWHSEADRKGRQAVLAGGFGGDVVSGDEPGVALLPTPTTQDGANNGGPSQFQRNTLPLNAEVTLLSTPQSRDFKGVPADNFNNANLCRDVANTAQWGKYAPAIARWEQVLGRPAPPPTEPNKNGNPRLAAEFSSWLMGWPAGWVTDPAIGISRNDQLRIVGNGVCPQQAAAALRFLLAVTA